MLLMLSQVCCGRVPSGPSRSELRNNSLLGSSLPHAHYTFHTGIGSGKNKKQPVAASEKTWECEEWKYP